MPPVLPPWSVFKHSRQGEGERWREKEVGGGGGKDRGRGRRREREGRVVCVWCEEMYTPAPQVDDTCRSD